MFRVQAVRLARTPRTVASRSYVTVPPPSGQSSPLSGLNKSTSLVLGAALAAAGGYYYYSTRPDDVQRFKDRAKNDKEEGRRLVGDAQAAGHQKLSEVEARARQASSDAQGKYESTKTSSQRSLSDARDLGEHKYDEAKDTVERKYNDAKSAVEDSYNKSREKLGTTRDRAYDEAKGAVHAVERKGEEVKEGWFSWLGWGMQKAQETKKEGAQKVAESAGDVKKASEKRT